MADPIDPNAEPTTPPVSNPEPQPPPPPPIEDDEPDDDDEADEEESEPLNKWVMAAARRAMAQLITARATRLGGMQASDYMESGKCKNLFLIGPSVREEFIIEHAIRSAMTEERRAAVGLIDTAITGLNAKPDQTLTVVEELTQVRELIQAKDA